MTLLQRWDRISLVKRIVVGLALGALLGFAAPGLTFLSVLGTLFVNALRALAPLLVFFLVMHSLAQHTKGGSSNMGTVLVLYLLGTFLAALCAVAAASARFLAGLERAGAALTPAGSRSSNR